MFLFHPIPCLAVLLALSAPAYAQDSAPEWDASQASPLPWVPPVDGAERPIPGKRSPIVRTPQATPGRNADQANPPGPDDKIGGRLAERLHFDQQEGTQWVYGKDYKASANAGGFSFMPFLGSDAPITYQVHMRLAEASLGGEALDLQGTERVLRQGDRWTIDRGAIDVTYDLALESIEQSFVLKVPIRGSELVLDIAVDSDLASEFSKDEVTYANELGGVTYTHAVVVDGKGRRLDIPIQAGPQGLRLVVPAEFMRHAVAPLIVDPILSAYRVNPSSTLALSSAEVAYDLDTNTFAYVHVSRWSSLDNDVWVETYDASLGNQTALASFDFSSETYHDPSIASDNTSDQFLVVATHGSYADRPELTGRAFDATQINRRSPKFLIASSTGSDGDEFGWLNQYPDVGGKSQGASLFKVVWVRRFFDVGGGYHQNIRSCAVTPVVPLSTSTAPSVTTARAETTGFSVLDYYPSISKSSGTAAVAEWRLVYAHGASGMYSGLTADDNTVTSLPTLFGGAPGNALLDMEVTTGLENVQGPFGNDPVYMAAYAVHGIGLGPGYIRIHAIQGNQSFASRLLHRELENHLPGRWSFGLGVAASRTRFSVAYKEHFASTDHYNCLSTSLDLTNDFQWAVSERRLYLADIGPGSPNQRTIGMASRYSGGMYTSRYVAHAIHSKLGALNTIEARVVFPSGPTPPAANYCRGNPNSTGGYGFISMEGTTATTGDKTLTASGMPNFQFGYFLASNGGAGRITPPGSAGVFCLAGGPLGRYNNGLEVFFTGTGDSASLVVNPTSLRGPNGNSVATAGQTWNFQAWHRENGGSSNFTNAVSLRFD